MERRLFSVGLLLQLCAACGPSLGSFGCAGGPASPHTTATPTPTAVVPAPPASPPSLSSPLDAGQVDAAADVEPKSERIVRASLPLRADLAPCRFVFRAGVGGQTDFGRYLMGIDRIETEASETCAEQVVFDIEAEKRSDPNGFLDSLEGGLLPNLGKLDIAAAQTDGPPPLFVDANFDGYLDLCVVAMSGAYNQSYRFWLFDPAGKRFVRSKELEDLLMPRVDAKRKRVEAGGRAGGPVYVGSEHEWVNGTLETVWSETTYLGENPNGGPLPKGFSKYRVRYERRGGKQRKVFDGPAR